LAFAIDLPEVLRLDEVELVSTIILFLDLMVIVAHLNHKP